jgi:hypothetical protein
VRGVGFAHQFTSIVYPTCDHHSPTCRGAGRKKIRQVYPDQERSWTCIFNTIWRFYHEISERAVVIARRGTKKIMAVGDVTRTAYYDEEQGRERVGSDTERYYSNFIEVEWKKKEIEFDEVVFPFQTVYEISEEKYSRLVEGKTLAEEEGVKEPEFTLGKYLEESITANFDTIFKGKLKLFVDPEGNIGKQYPTDIGNIDILAEEPDAGPYVVIELKKGREPDTVAGQTLRYMGWVEENLCEEGQSVKGLVICRERDPRLTYGLKVAPNVEVKFYKASFQLSSEPQA